RRQGHRRRRWWRLGRRLRQEQVASEWHCVRGATARTGQRGADDAGGQSSSVSTFSKLIVVALAGLAACDDDGKPIAADASPLDAFQPPWWTPHVHEAPDWDVQLVAPFDVSTRKMYELNLFDVTGATTITYADNSTVDVPAGPLAGKIDA